MKDLTEGSVVRQIVLMAAPIAMNMLTQVAYQLVNLYFVTRIGVAATAGVNAAGNAVFIVTGLTQVLSAGTVALVAHAAGRHDQRDANALFNQSMALAIACGVIATAVLYLSMGPYMRSVAADAATINAGATFMSWVLPGYALMLPMAAFSTALRGIGLVRPTMIVYTLTVLLNAALAPVLIAGWGPVPALGVRGAGLATTCATLIGLVLLAAYFHRVQDYMACSARLMSPRLVHWSRILRIGLPAGGEFALMFLYTAVVYYAIRDFGAAAQAGFGIGSRVLQTILLPGMSVAMAAGPIAGQSFGARKAARVRATFHSAALLGAAVMVAITAFVEWRPRALLAVYDADAASLDVAATFLQFASWTLIAQGVAYTCSTMFQSLGNTVPALMSSALRLLVFAVPAVWLSRLPGFHLEQVWYLWIVSIALHAVVSVGLLRLELNARLVPARVPRGASPAL
jgi:putative MATE family efflux protein